MAALFPYALDANQGEGVCLFNLTPKKTLCVVLGNRVILVAKCSNPM